MNKIKYYPNACNVVIWVTYAGLIVKKEAILITNHNVSVLKHMIMIKMTISMDMSNIVTKQTKVINLNKKNAHGAHTCTD